MRRNPPSRVFVADGFMWQTVDARPVSGPAAHAPYEYGTYHVKIPVSNLDGTPATGEYRGPGTIVRGDDKRLYLILGDPYTTSQLHEYALAEQPTAESLADFDDFRAGFTDGFTGKRKRRNEWGGSPYLDGHKRGQEARKAQS